MGSGQISAPWTRWLVARRNFYTRNGSLLPTWWYLLCTLDWVLACHFNACWSLALAWDVKVYKPHLRHDIYTETLLIATHVFGGRVSWGVLTLPPESTLDNGMSVDEGTKAQNSSYLFKKDISIPIQCNLLLPSNHRFASGYQVRCSLIVSICQFSS